MQVERVEQILAGDREREVAVRLLDEKEIAKLRDVAEKREVVGDRPRPSRSTGGLEQQARLIEQVEREIAERELLFEHGSVTAPLGQPMAEHEPIVAEAERVFGEIALQAILARHQRPRTPRGTL